MEDALAWCVESAEFVPGESAAVDIAAEQAKQQFEEIEAAQQHVPAFGPKVDDIAVQ